MSHRQRPVEVEAAQFTGFNMVELAKVMGCEIDSLEGALDGEFTLETPEGDLQVVVTDWVVKGPGGELRVVADANFHLSYEAVQ